MLLVHFSIGGKAAICACDNILLAEEIEGKDENGDEIHCTRIYLKQPLPGENETSWLDVQESVEKIAKMMK